MDHVPRMDWSVQNQADTFKLFKQRIELYFKAKRIEPEDQVVHILLQVGDEGLRRYNSWSLTEDERKDPGKIFEKFMEQLEPSENYRISRLKLMHFRQQQDENLDCFINRCKLLALKCEFEDNELNKRLIELIIAGTPIPDYQKELLGKNKNFTLDEATQLGRAYEASASHVQQIRYIWEQPRGQLSIASNVVRTYPPGVVTVANNTHSNRVKVAPRLIPSAERVVR